MRKMFSFSLVIMLFFGSDSVVSGNSIPISFSSSISQTYNKKSNPISPILNLNIGSWSIQTYENFPQLGDGGVALSKDKVFLPNGFNYPSNIYDLNSKTFIKLPSSIEAHNWSKEPILLKDGRIFVVGGFKFDNGWVPSTMGEIYDPKTNKWTPTENMIYEVTATIKASKVLLPNGHVFVSGGSKLGKYNRYDGSDNINQNFIYIDDAAIYNPFENKWKTVAKMNFARGEHLSLALHNGKVFVIGGEYQGSGFNTPREKMIPHPPELYDPETNSWTILSKPEGVYFSDILLLKNGKILVSSIDFKDNYTKLEIYDLNTNKWEQIPVEQNFNEHGMPVSSKFRFFLLENGNAFLIPFYWGTTPKRTTFIYDVSQNRLFNGPEFKIPSVAGTVVPMPDGQLIIFRHLEKTVEIFTPLK